MRSVMRKLSPEAVATLLVVVAAFAAVTFDAWRIARAPRETTYIPMQAVITPEIELLRDYIRFDTSNPPGREVEAVRWLQQRLAEAGIQSEIIEPAPGRANLYARLKGREKGDVLMLTHHVDVVPAAPEAWTEPPFAANIRMNQLYGRGVLDMKSIGICHLIAFIDLAKSTRPLKHDVVFLAVADEETGGEWGMRWLVENRPDIFENVRYALSEGGISETLAEKVTYFGIEVGTKQTVSLQLTAPSRRALELARTSLLPLQSPEDPTRVLPAVTEVLRRIAEYRVSGRDQLMDVERTIREGDFWKLHITYRYLMQNIVRCQGIEPTARGFEMEAVLENLPDEEPGRVVELVSRLVEPHGVKVTEVQSKGPSPISSWDTPFFDAIEGAVRSTYGEVDVGPQLQPFVTNDSWLLRNMGVDAYGMWPFPVTLYQSMGVHGVDERVRLDWFVMGVDMTRSLVFGYATGGQGMSRRGDN